MAALLVEDVNETPAHLSSDSVRGEWLADVETRMREAGTEGLGEIIMSLSDGRYAVIKGLTEIHFATLKVDKLEYTGAHLPLSKIQRGVGVLSLDDIVALIQAGLSLRDQYKTGQLMLLDAQDYPAYYSREIRRDNSPDASWLRSTVNHGVQADPRGITAPDETGSADLSDKSVRERYAEYILRCTGPFDPTSAEDLAFKEYIVTLLSLGHYWSRSRLKYAEATPNRRLLDLPERSRFRITYDIADITDQRPIGKRSTLPVEIRSWALNPETLDTAYGMNIRGILAYAALLAGRRAVGGVHGRQSYDLTEQFVQYEVPFAAFDRIACIYSELDQLRALPARRAMVLPVREAQINAEIDELIREHVLAYLPQGEFATPELVESIRTNLRYLLNMGKSYRRDIFMDLREHNSMRIEFLDDAPIPRNSKGAILDRADAIIGNTLILGGLATAVGVITVRYILPAISPLIEHLQRH